MKRILIFIICFLCYTPVVSQVYYNRLLSQITNWDTVRINTVLTEKISSLPGYLKERYIPLINYASENYEETVVFQVDFSSKESIVEINIVNNDFPLDLYYVTNRFVRCDVKLVVLTYNGEVEIVNKGIISWTKGLARKEAKAFRYINKQRPDFIFVCNDIFGCFFYVKDGIIYVYDYYNHEIGPFQDNSRVMKLIKNE